MMTVLLEALQLKELPRAGWLRAGLAAATEDAAESVAAHSWGVAWLVAALCPDDIDRGRALEIAVVHDLAEVRTGDITPHDGVAPNTKAAAEDAATRAIVAPLSSADRLYSAWREYEDGATPEARFVKACDKLDMALQAVRYGSGGAAQTSEFIDSARASLATIPEGRPMLALLDALTD